MSPDSTSTQDSDEKRTHFCRKAILDLKKDFTNKRWVSGFYLFLGVCWFFGLIGALVAFNFSAWKMIDGKACLPDGSFRVSSYSLGKADNPDVYNFWSMSNFFQITVGGGELSFTQAKVIDVIWDVVGSIYSNMGYDHSVTT